VLGLVRVATDERDGQLPEPFRQRIAALGEAIGRLADTSQSWPAQLRDDVAKLAASELQRANSPGPDHPALLASILGHAADDLLRLMSIRA